VSDTRQQRIEVLKTAARRKSEDKTRSPQGFACAENSGTISVMGDCDAAQAVELVRALCDQLREMTHHLAWIDGRDVPGTNGHAMRLEAAALRRDIAEAQRHIDRLERRYLSGDERTQQRPAGGRSRAMVDLLAK